MLYLPNGRIGRFDIDLQMLRSEPEICKKIMAQCLIIRAECVLSRGVIEYEAICDKFKDLSNGDEIPKYRVEIFNVTNDGDCDIWFKEMSW